MLRCATLCCAVLQQACLSMSLLCPACHLLLQQNISRISPLVLLSLTHSCKGIHSTPAAAAISVTPTAAVLNTVCAEITLSQQVYRMDTVSTEHQRDQLQCMDQSAATRCADLAGCVGCARCALQDVHILHILDSGQDVH